MARRRVHLQLVQNESNRRSTFKKRKASFFKKLSELSTLCAVPACAVVYNGPDDLKPDTWPDPDQTSEILTKFCSMSEADQTKKMLDGDGFLQKQAAILQRHLKKAEGESANLQAGILLNDVLSGRCQISDMASLETLSNMSLLVETRIKAVYKRIGELIPVPSVPTVPVPDQHAGDVAEVVSDNNWVNQVVGPTEGGMLEAVPAGMLSPRADMASASEEFVIEESDKKNGFSESRTSADVAPTDDEDLFNILNFLDAGFFNESDGTC